MKFPSILLSSAALTFASFGGCVGYSDGIEVAIWVRPSLEGALSDVELGDGTTMHVDALTLSIESAELVACGATGGGHHHSAVPRDAVLRDAMLRDRARALSALLLPVAAAQHHHGSPLIVSGPFLIDLRQDAVALPALFSPAPGCYDRVILSLTALTFEAHQADGVVSSSSAAVIAANAPLDPPLEITGLMHPELEVTLARVQTFALLDGLPAGLDGDRVLAGIAAQTDARTME